MTETKNGESVMHNGMEHFGISNVKRRLNIIYGKAVQRGSHEKLIDEEGLYAKLWKTQAKYYQKTQ